MSERLENVTGSNCFMTTRQKEKSEESLITVMVENIYPAILFAKYFRKFSHNFKMTQCYLSHEGYQKS